MTFQITLPKVSRRSEGRPDTKEVDHYVTLYLEGYTAYEIGLAYKRKSQSIVDWLQERGYTGSRFRVGDEITAEWPELYHNKGKTLKEIAELYGTSPGTVRVHLYRQGVRIRHPAWYCGKRGSKRKRKH